VAALRQGLIVLANVPGAQLAKRCVAKCDWSFAIEQQHIVGVKGFVPVAYMKTILEQLALLGQLPKP
jgi:hypothetical protein